jgi:hypothetical protein
MNLPEPMSTHLGNADFEQFAAAITLAGLALRIPKPVNKMIAVYDPKATWQMPNREVLRMGLEIAAAFNIPLHCCQPQRMPRNPKARTYNLFVSKRAFGEHFTGAEKLTPRKKAPRVSKHILAALAEAERAKLDEQGLPKE